jgi:hypothetical protein
MEGRAFFSRKSGEVFSENKRQKEKIVRLIMLGSCFLETSPKFWRNFWVRVSEMKQRATKLRRVKKSCVGGWEVLEIM